MSHRRLWFPAVGSLLALVLVLAAGCGKGPVGGKPAVDAQKAPIKLGVIYSASGASAHVGAQQKATVEMVVQEVNAQGGVDGHLLQPVFENDDSNTEKAVSAAKKLVYSDKVIALLGVDTSSGIAAVQKVTEAEKVPFISIVGSSPKLTTKGQEWYFRNATSSDFQTKSLVKYAMQKLGLKRFAVLYDAARAQDQAQGFTRDLKEAGLEPVIQEKFQTGDTNFNAQLLKIKAQDPDALMVLGMITEGAAAARQARDMGIKARLLGVVALAYDDYIKLAGGDAEGTIAPSTFKVDNPLPAVQAFVKKYRAKTNENPDHAAAQTDDAINILLGAFKSAGLSLAESQVVEDRAKVRDALLKVKDYQGVAGSISYGTKDHEGYEDPMLVEVKGGKWVVVRQSGE